jgi:hypothetical protein
MHPTNTVLSIAVSGSLLLTACAAPKRAPQSAGDYYSSLEYQSRETLRQSLFKSDQALLSNEEIEAILSSRIELPREAHMAILRLGSENEVLAWAFLTGAENPLSVLSNAQRLSRISWLPSLLVPERLSVPLLREAAARFQADFLLVYRTPCQRFQEYRLFGTDESKTYCVAEGVLLDVRTGIVPFSGVASEEVVAQKAPEDVSLYETMKKAEAAATNSALADLARQLVDFLESAP